MSGVGLINIVKIKAFKISTHFFENCFSINENAEDELGYYNDAKFLFDLELSSWTTESVSNNFDKVPRF